MRLIKFWGGGGGGVQNGYYQEFQYLMLSIHLFPKEATLLESFMSDKLQSQRKIF